MTNPNEVSNITISDSGLLRTVKVYYNFGCWSVTKNNEFHLAVMETYAINMW